MAQSITEKDGIHRQWYVDAKKIEADTLPEFIRHLTEDYSHDYGTICHAIAAAAIAAAWAVEKSPQGGITGFQGGAVMWGFITNWSTQYKGKPVRLIDYSNMLYPQYSRKFEKTISASNHRYLVDAAKRNLLDADHAAPDVRAHWHAIADGVVPFGYSIAED